ncbi:MAG: GtrA family protein [Oscillospiraceae bacterium]|nr:GtrA family protein [Oscillospiraceae bacterium]
MTKQHFRKIFGLFPKPLRDLLIGYENAIIYIFYGALTTLVNYAVHFGLRLAFVPDKDWGSLSQILSSMETSAIPSGAATVISWVAAVIFAFFTNKYFVFEKTDKNHIWMEFARFACGRLMSLGLEALLMWVFVDKLAYNELIMKLLASVLVLIINYFLSKFLVFKKE